MKRQLTILKKELSLIEGALAYTENNVITTSGSFWKDPRGYYYLQTRVNGKNEKKYLGKADSDMVKLHKKNEINRRICESLKVDKRAIEICLHSLTDISPIDIPFSLPSKYAGIDASLVNDAKLDEMIAWANAPYQKNSKDFPNQMITSCDGTRMRSKGECIWYNSLIEEKLLFRNDMLMEFVNLDGKKEVIAPDFVIRCYDGSYIIVEHMGLLLSGKYAFRSTEKIRIYINNGFTLGTDLFITSDDKHGGTDGESIKNLIALIKRRVLKGAPPHVKMMFD